MLLLKTNIRGMQKHFLPVLKIANSYYKKLYISFFSLKTLLHVYFAERYDKKNMTSPEKVAEAKAEHFAHIIPPHSRQ